MDKKAIEYQLTVETERLIQLLESLELVKGIDTKTVDAFKKVILIFRKVILDDLR